MKHYILNRIAEANIDDEDFKFQIMESCARAVDNVLDREIEYYQFINDPANVHEELWQHNDNIFELEFVDEATDLHFEAKIEPQETTGKYIGKVEATCLGVDRDNVINELYNGPDIREYVNWDYKKIMAMIYYDFQDSMKNL